MAVIVEHTKSMDEATRLEKNRRSEGEAHRSSTSHGSQEERSDDRDLRLWRENAA